MRNEFGIKEELYNSMIDIFKNTKEVIEVILFGSRVNDTYKEVSDIDLAIKFLGQSKKLEIIRKLEILRSPLKFDVLDIDELENERLLNDIKKEGILIFKR